MLVRTGSPWQRQEAVDRLAERHGCLACQRGTCWLQRRAAELAARLRAGKRVDALAERIERESVDALLRLAELGASDEELEARDDEVWALLTLAAAETRA